MKEFVVATSETLPPEAFAMYVKKETGLELHYLGRLDSVADQWIAEGIRRRDMAGYFAYQEDGSLLYIEEKDVYMVLNPSVLPKDL